MATMNSIPQARLNRILDEVDFAQRMAGERPTTADREAARRVLTDELTPDQVIAGRLAELEVEHGFMR